MDSAPYSNLSECTKDTQGLSVQGHVRTSKTCLLGVNTPVSASDQGGWVKCTG